MNGLLAGFLATLLSLPWYGPRALGMLAQVGARSGRQAAEAGHPDPFTWAGLSLYPRWFIPQFGILAVVLFVVGLAIAVRQRRGLIVSVLVPFVFLSLIQNKNLRYTLPILPAASVVAALGFASVRGLARSVVVGAIAVAALVQISGTTFGVPRWRSLPGLRVPWLLNSSPMRTDWHHREILALLRRESRAAPAMVSVVPNDNFFSVSNFRYYAVRDGLSLRWMRAWDDDPIGVEFMILKTGDQGPKWTAAKPHRITERFATDEHLARAFPVIGGYPLPDGSVATVRARRIPPYDAPPGAIAEAVAAAVRRRAPEFAKDLDGLGIALEWDGDIVRGRVRRLVLTAHAATLGEFRRRETGALRVRDVRLVVDDVLVNPGSAVALGRLDLLDAARIVIERATVTEADLASFLGSMRESRRMTVKLANGVALVRLRQAGPDLSARLRILPATDRPFALAADEARIGGVPIPSALVNWVIGNYDPTLRMAARLPIHVEIGDVTISDGAIRIGR